MESTNITNPHLPDDDDGIIELENESSAADSLILNDIGCPLDPNSENLGAKSK